MVTNAPHHGPTGDAAQARDTLRANPDWAIPNKGKSHCGCGNPYQRREYSLTKDGRTSLLDAGLSAFLVSDGWTPSEIAGWRDGGIAPPHVEREVVAQLVENTERAREATHRELQDALGYAAWLARATLADLRWLRIRLSAPRISTPRARRGGRRGVTRGGLAAASGSEPEPPRPQPARPAPGALLDEIGVSA